MAVECAMNWVNLPVGLKQLFNKHLASHNHREVAFLGRIYKTGKYNSESKKWDFNENGLVFTSGGAGYALSSQTLKLMCTEPYPQWRNLLFPGEPLRTRESAFELCVRDFGNRQMEHGASDVAIAKCLEREGVTPSDSRDGNFRERWHAFNMRYTFDAPVSGREEWVGVYQFYGYDMGGKCCSPESVSFHYETPVSMFALDFLLYISRMDSFKNSDSETKRRTVHDYLDRVHSYHPRMDLNESCAQNQKFVAPSLNEIIAEIDVYTHHPTVYPFIHNLRENIAKEAELH